MRPYGTASPSRLLPLLALAATGFGQATAAHTRTVAHLPLHRLRSSPSDLEVGGDLEAVPAGQTRFVRYRDLLRIPQQRFIARGDSNFIHPPHLSGIPLESLPALFHAAPDARMVTALCDDSYKANYPAAYLQAHHPVLVLRIEGKPPAGWPRSEDGSSMGPFLISHESFTPSFQVLSHIDEPQVPWGVIRIDIRRESTVYAPITPAPSAAANLPVQQGFAIARQNCFRCHNQQTEGGFKANRSWAVIARRSVADARYFDAYVRNPQLANPGSQMAPSPIYDDATLLALRAYFAKFAKPRED